MDAYIHTTSPTIANPFQRALVSQARNSLISIVTGLSGPKLGQWNVDRLLCDIGCYRKTFKDEIETLFIDSSGYSIIKGDIPPARVNEVIGVYTGYMAAGDYDVIMSLDIPTFANERDRAMNTVRDIYDFNYRSLSETIDVIKSNPALANKAAFIWQWRTHKQFEIWKSLYKRLDIPRYFKRRAIGGMVSMMGLTNVPFVPFIGPLFKCIDDYLHEGDYSDDLHVHLLGISKTYERAVLFFLESVLCDYFSEKCQKSLILTYDTINYVKTSMYVSPKDDEGGKESRLSGRDVIAENKESEKASANCDINDAKLLEIYGSKEICDLFVEDLLRMKKSVKRVFAGSNAPLVIWLQKDIDRRLKIAAGNDHVKKLFGQNNEFVGMNICQYYLKEVNDSAVGTKHNRKMIQNSIQIGNNLFNTLKNNKRNDFHKLLAEYVVRINYPYKLSGELSDIPR